MTPAVSVPRARAVSAKLRPPLPSASSAASRAVPRVPALPVEVPLPLPTLSELQEQQPYVPTASLIAERLASLAYTYLSLCSTTDDLSDVLSWEVDLCSATFYASYALALNPHSTRARRILARCVRLGGFNIALPMSPSGSAGLLSVSATKMNSFDNKDQAGAQACIHILQQGPPATFQDPGSAKEYREACRLLGRNADAMQVSELLTDKAQGKRKALDDLPGAHHPPELVPRDLRYSSQLTTDDAYESSRRNQITQAHSQFRSALDKDPFSWRALTGLCDATSSTSSLPHLVTVEVLDKIYARLEQEIRAPYFEAESAITSMSQPAPAMPTDMARKISEDGMNKKLKVSSDRPATLTAASRKPTSKVAPPAPTTAQSTVTATRAPPISRALSTAQTNTTQIKPTDDDDVKGSIRSVTEAQRIARVNAPRTATVTNSTTTAGRQLRSTVSRRPDAPAASRATSTPSLQVGRPGAISKAGSMSSASSGSTVTSASARATSATIRTAALTRQAPADTTTASEGAKRSVSGRTVPASTLRSTSTTPVARATSSTRPVVNTARSVSSVSKSSGTTHSTVRASSTGATSLRSTPAAQTAADREAVATASATRVKLEQLVQLRESCLEQLRLLVQYHAIDLYIVGIVHQAGEVYRLLRLCQGDLAAQVLQQPIMASLLAKTHDVDGETQVVSLLDSHACQSFDAHVQSSIVHHLLSARAYTECSQYAPAETHFAHVRALNPYVTAHMDIYSLVLFHLSREVTLSALAQHLTLVSPASAATQIVIGNAFSLQKEHQTALICFQRAAATNPDYAYAYTLAGHEAYDLGLLDEAIAYFRNAIRCDRRHWNGWAGLGRVFLEIGDHEHAACKSLQMAIEINPCNYLLWDLVGWTFSLINAPVKALECYDRAIELAPRASVLTYLRRAELLLQCDRHAASHQNLVVAHDLAPEEASIHILLAQSYMRLGKGEFCQLDTPASMPHKAGASSIPLRATGTMVHPIDYQAEISHHLAVAIDLDPTLLRVVKSICEGHKTLPGHGGAQRRDHFDPHDMHSLQDIQGVSYDDSGDVDTSRQQYSAHEYSVGRSSAHAGMSTPQTRNPAYAPNSSVMSFSNTSIGLPTAASSLHHH